ncbi:MAG: hypothetical protein ACTSRZ_11425 [Promethearchaeota archaeon]
MINILLVEKDAPMFLGVFYEFSAICISLLSLAHCYSKRGKWTTIKIFIIGMIYGLVLENGGPMIAPQFGFEGYFWEENYKLYLFEFFGYGIRISKVPIATHLGWPMVFYIAVIFWERICQAFPSIKNHLVISGVVISSSGLLFDLPFDIIATRFNWWV